MKQRRPPRVRLNRKEPIEFTTTRMPKTSCLACDYRMDASSPTRGGDAVPKEDDFTLCFNCGALYRYNRDLTIRRATHADLDGLDPKTAYELGSATGAILKRGRFQDTAGPSRIEMFPLPFKPGRN